jgi:hypothetical protein
MGWLLPRARPSPGHGGTECGGPAVMWWLRRWRGGQPRAPRWWGGGDASICSYEGGGLTWGGQRRRRGSSPVMGWRLPTRAATWWGLVGKRWRKFVEEERGAGLIGGVMPRNRGGESSSWPRKWRWGRGGLVLVHEEVVGRCSRKEVGSLARTASSGAVAETRAIEVTLAVGEREADPWAWLPDSVNSQLLNKF